MWHELYVGYQYFVLAYFALLNLQYGAFTYFGLRSIVVAAREFSQVALKDFVEREIYEPVSILVPAHNEQESIVASVDSFLSLNFPDFEVIVVSDGSTDETVQRLIEAFDLVEHERLRRRIIDTARVRRVFRSLRRPGLHVVEKDWGGKADSLNAGLNLAQCPLICPVDGDSLLDAEAILRASRMFTEDDTLLAIGGTVRPLNAAVARDGLIKDLRLPRRWIERFQILEYARAFFVGRAGWSHFGMLLMISGAFGMFKRDAVERVGGFLVGTVGEDVELVFRMHKQYARSGTPYRMAFTPDPICWTEVPSDLSTLRRQRNRWQRGLWEALWLHRDMLFNPRYGRVGLVALPYFLVFEALAPLIEVTGYVVVLATLLVGPGLSVFVVLFLLLAILYGVLLSQAAVGIETLLLARYPRGRDRMILFAAAGLEYLGYRQLLTLERFIAVFQLRRKRGHWGQMRRAVSPSANLPASWTEQPERQGRSTADPVAPVEGDSSVGSR